MTDPIKRMYDEAFEEPEDTALDHIALVWTTDDVLSVRPELSRDQAREVLRAVEHDHDATVGVTWTTLEVTADMMFPQGDA
jgi:hypothetical protein